MAAGPLGLVSEMEESAGKAGINMMIANRINQLIIGVVSGVCGSVLLGERRCFRERIHWGTEINRSDSQNNGESYRGVDQATD